MSCNILCLLHALSSLVVPLSGFCSVGSLFLCVSCVFVFLLVVSSLKFVLKNKNIKVSKNMNKNNLSGFWFDSFSEKPMMKT